MTESNRSFPFRFGNIRDEEDCDDCERGSSDSDAVVMELASLKKLRLLLLPHSLDVIEGVALLDVDALSTFMVEESLLPGSSNVGVLRREDLLSEDDCFVN